MIKSAHKSIKEFQDSLEDMVSELESQKKAPAYIVGILKAVKSWLRYNDITLTRVIKVSNPNSTPTIENEQVPTKEELARILRASPPRIRVAEALMAFADLRPESIGNHDGSDGLTLKDLPETEIQNGQVVFKKIPTIIVVRSTLSKTRSKYHTFLPQEGCDYLKEYLEMRILNKEKLTPDTSIFGHEKPRKTKREFATTRKISHFIRKYMRSAGIFKRPYVLRAYAETQLIIAESKGKISHPYLQFIAGHKGDIESRYSTNKGRLPPDMIEDMREQYRACESFLSTASKVDESSVVKEAKIEALKSIAKNLLGVNLEETMLQRTAGQKEELNSDEELALFEEQLRRFRDGWSMGPPAKKDCENKLITENELEGYLNKGWEMAQIINSKILIRRPS